MINFPPLSSTDDDCFDLNSLKKLHKYIKFLLTIYFYASYSCVSNKRPFSDVDCFTKSIKNVHEEFK